MVVRPEWWEFVTRKFFGQQESSWIRFWLSPTGRVVTRIAGAAFAVAGIVGLSVSYYVR